VMVGGTIIEERAKFWVTSTRLSALITAPSKDELNLKLEKHKGKLSARASVPSLTDQVKSDHSSLVTSRQGLETIFCRFVVIISTDQCLPTRKEPHDIEHHP